MGVWKVLPALAAGCTVILKPSELAPLSCLLLAGINACYQYALSIHPITKVANATKEDIDLAVQAAKNCLHGPTWGYASNGQQRATVLRRLGVLVTARKDELARLDSLDQGKPLRESEADVNDTITACEHFAMLAETHDTHVETIENGTGGDFTTTVVHEPIGVVAGNIVLSQHS